MKNLFPILALLFFVSCATTSNNQTYLAPSEMQQNSELVISRVDGFLYSGVSANIRLNGARVGSLSKGSSQNFYAPPGRNLISISGSGSPGESTVSFNTKKGETYSLIVKPRGGKTLAGGILGGALFLALETDGKVGGLFSIALVSSTEEKKYSSESKETLLLKLKSLYDKELISKEVYEKQQLEILSE